MLCAPVRFLSFLSYLYLRFRMKNINFALVIELDRHIEILLLKSDCVIVPGLGGFVASHVAARYDGNDGMFIPPLRTLGFNPKLRVNDSLLVQSYSDAYDISFPDALTRIEAEVEELRQHVENNGVYELNNIGTLYLNGDGNLEFKPCEAGILTPGLYGLSSFEMNVRAGGRSADAEKPAGKVVSVTFPVGDVVADGVPANDFEKVTNTNEEGRDGKSVQIKVSALRNLVAAIIAVVLFLALGTPVNESVGTVRTSGIGGEVVSRLVSDGYDKIVNSSDGLKLSSRTGVKERDAAIAGNKESGKTAESNVADVKAGIGGGDYYCIVLASQVTKKNAQAFGGQLEKDVFGKAYVLVGKNKSVKVAYGRFESQNDAYNELNNLRNDERFYEAWVYQVKN